MGRGRTLCCGMILLLAVNMYSSHWLIIKLNCPLARNSKAGLSKQRNGKKPAAKPAASELVLGMQFSSLRTPVVRKR